MAARREEGISCALTEARISVPVNSPGHKFDPPRNPTIELTALETSLLTDLSDFRRGLLSFWGRPKGTRTQQPSTSQRLTALRKESIVTKRVAFGELFPFLRTKADKPVNARCLKRGCRAFCVYGVIWQRFTTIWPRPPKFSVWRRIK